MVLGVINPPQVFDGDHAVTRLVQLPKRLHDHLLPGLGHLRLPLTDEGSSQTWNDAELRDGCRHIYPQSDEELVKVDGPAAVAVKAPKESRGLVFLHQDPEVIQTLRELLEVEGAVVVIVHDFKGSDKQTQSYDESAEPLCENNKVH